VVAGVVLVEASVNDVVVIGAGFAGTAAACRLAGDGHRPLLLEGAPRLGGRASSFFSAERGDWIDYGQHALMRCCTASTGFLLRIGASHAVRFQPTLSIPILSPTGRFVLRSSFLPGILHLAPALLRYRALPLRDRFRVMEAGLALSVGKAGADALFAQWLADHRQPDRAIRRLWDPICIAALNASASAVGLQAARKVFHDAFFRPGGADLGFFTVPLCEVFELAHRYIEQSGGTVRHSSRARRLIVRRDRVCSVELETGETVKSRTIVCAIPPMEFSRLARETDALALLVEKARRLRWAPIVDLHAWFDRPVLDDEFAVAVDSPVQAVFDVTRLHDRKPNDGATHLVLSQSAADEWIDRPFAEATKSLLGALSEVVPRVRQARCLGTLVVRHRHATFVPEPDSDRLRPRAATPIRGLYLAGDWTSTGWPSTIEGAIRSGIAAAARAELQLGSTDEPAGSTS
jgi:squalene-associated FAD-dependent desaturase